MPRPPHDKVETRCRWAVFAERAEEERWENISLPAGPLCGFCRSLNVFHCPYFRASLGVNGNRAALYLCLICSGREKRFWSYIFLPWLCSHLLAGTACFLTEKKTLVNQVNGRGKKKKDHRCRSFNTGTGIQPLFVCVGSLHHTYSCIGNESRPFCNLLKNWAKHRWIKNLQHGRFLNAGARPSEIRVYAGPEQLIWKGGGSDYPYDLSRDTVCTVSPLSFPLSFPPPPLPLPPSHHSLNLFVAWLGVHPGPDYSAV